MSTPDEGSAAPEVRGGRARSSTIIYRINAALHSVAGFVLIGIMLYIVADVAGRKLFATPMPGTAEVSELGLVILIYFGLGYAQHHGDHVAIDLLTSRLNNLAQRVVDICVGLLSTAVILLLAWRMALYAGLLSNGNYATPTFGIPMYPFAWIAVAGLVAYALAILATSFTRSAAVKDGESLGI